MSVFIYLICFARLLICCLLFAVVAGFCFCLFFLTSFLSSFISFLPFLLILSSPLFLHSLLSSIFSPSFLYSTLLYSPHLLFSPVYSLFSSPLSSSLFSSLPSSSFRIYFPRPYSLSNDYKSQCPIIPLSQRCEWDWVASAWLIHLFAGFCLWLAFNPDFPAPSVFLFFSFLLPFVICLGVFVIDLFLCVRLIYRVFFRRLLYPSTCLYPRVISW